jgi:hypothetical protein
MTRAACRVGKRLALTLSGEEYGGMPVAARYTAKKGLSC